MAGSQKNTDIATLARFAEKILFAPVGMGSAIIQPYIQAAKKLLDDAPADFTAPFAGDAYSVVSRAFDNLDAATTDSNTKAAIIRGGKECADLTLVWLVSDAKGLVQSVADEQAGTKSRSLCSIVREKADRWRAEDGATKSQPDRASYGKRSNGSLTRDDIRTALSDWMSPRAAEAASREIREDDFAGVIQSLSNLRNAAKTSPDMARAETAIQHMATRCPISLADITPGLADVILAPGFDLNALCAPAGTQINTQFLSEDTPEDKATARTTSGDNKDSQTTSPNATVPSKSGSIWPWVLGATGIAGTLIAVAVYAAGEKTKY